MNNKILLLCLLFFILSCSKHDRINPYDPNSSTWLPWSGTISDTSADVNDSFTVKVTNHTPEAVSSYHWYFNEVETITTVDSLTFSITETGSYPVIFYTTNHNNITSESITAYFTITASAPITSPINDTIINDLTVQIYPTATDTNSTGSIASFYWYPSGNPALKKSGSPFTITASDITKGTIIWGAVDDDGLESTDSFSVRFNKAPIISDLLISPYWHSYNHSIGTGTIHVTVISSDPDSTLDLLTNSIGNITPPVGVESLSESAFSLTNIPPHSSISFRVLAEDTVGGSSYRDSSIATPAPPTQIKIFCANTPFLMGDNSQWKDNVEQPVHSVTISHDLWCDSTEVTQQLFDSIAGIIPGYTAPQWESRYGLGPTHPAYSISWTEALLFCNERSKADGFDTVYSYDAITGTWGNDLDLTNINMGIKKSGYRLPTEAEWELLCRAGSNTIFHWGDSESESQANLYSWNSSNSEKTTHPVAEKQSNNYGLYDICGNLSEWCWDYFDETYYDVTPGTDPLGPNSGTEQVVRGGGRHSIIEYSLRSGARESSSKASRRIGFRTVRTAH